jgi:hypothetical protein
VKRGAPFLIVVGLIVVGSVSPTAAQDARTMAIVHTRLAAQSLAELETENERLKKAWSAVEAGNTAIVDAQQQGASLESLRSQNDRLQQREAELLMRVIEIQRTRRELLTHRAVVEATGGSQASEQEQPGVLTGRWDLAVQPGLEGTMYLVQQGTLISGTYALSGGWTGSFRGTVVGNKVRLERIDSQLGFAAIFYGEVDLTADPDAIQGRWEATQLATGLPSAGGWSAQRKD